MTTRYGTTRPFAARLATRPFAGARLATRPFARAAALDRAAF